MGSDTTIKRLAFFPAGWARRGHGCGAGAVHGAIPAAVRAAVSDTVPAALLAAVLAALLAAGCSAGSAAPYRATASTCYAFGVQALERHITVHVVPRACAA